jgi:hypothetical protein
MGCQTYGEAPRDSNAYLTGVIGQHNVVLVHMPNMGKVDAATAATSLQASFQGIQLALVVGICGGVPFGNQLSEDILLGDVVISKGLVQYDLGRQFPNNRFLRKDTPLDNLPRPARKIRAALAKLQTEQGHVWLQNKTLEHLNVLRQRLSNDIQERQKTDSLDRHTRTSTTGLWDVRYVLTAMGEMMYVTRPLG